VKWIFGVYSTYEAAKRGAGLLFKERGVSRGSANVILSEGTLQNTTLTGSDFREITGDTKAKPAAGDALDIKPSFDTEELAWLDHFLAGKKVITFRDAGPVYVAGETILSYIEETVSEKTGGGLTDVLTRIGLVSQDALIITEKLKNGAILLWVRTEDDMTGHAEELMRKGKADQIIVV
jgi:hypothetical protein